jgi:drug/metabolite transporter (DMT)-like permease
MSTEPHEHARLGLAAVMIAVTSWGVTGVITKSIDLDALAIAFWRFLVYAAALTALLAATRRRLTWSAMRVAAPSGLVLSGDVMLFFTAVKVTTIANATTIGAMQPIVIGVFATRFLGERIAGRQVVAASLAIVGVIAVVVESSGTPQWSGAGDLAAVGALLAWSAYFVLAKRATARLSTLEFTAATAWWVAIGTLPVGLIVGHDMSPPATSEWLAMLGLIVTGGVLGHTFMNWGIPRVPLWLSSTMTLVNPVIASVAAWLFLDETLNAGMLVAMLVVVAALTIVVTSKTPPTAEGLVVLAEPAT